MIALKLIQLDFSSFLNGCQRCGILCNGRVPSTPLPQLAVHTQLLRCQAGPAMINQELISTHGDLQYHH